MRAGRCHLAFLIRGDWMVVGEVVDSAVSAVLEADFVVVAFGVAVVVGEVGDRDVGGVDSLDVVDSAR